MSIKHLLYRPDPTVEENQDRDTHSGYAMFCAHLATMENRLRRFHASHKEVARQLEKAERYVRLNNATHPTPPGRA